jgi:cytochrome c oxidase cbb3-type subunit II
MTAMWEKRPVVFLILATAAILVGTTITMVLPFAWVNTESDRIATVTPYSALELVGRDVYIREGCNNCHTQTIRPLVAEVLRYGDYSRSGEFVYDRPHLWGSRRTGPDLARIGGKYPDAWHYQHMISPTSMVPRSNMPAYAFLTEKSVDPALTRKKMQVLAFPFDEDDIISLSGATEMDAMIAYLQKLGTGLPRQEAPRPGTPQEMVNPFPQDADAIQAGALLYERHCAACHGEDLSGGIGPELADLDWVDFDLFQIIFDGIPDGGMPGFSTLGSERVWQMVNFLKYYKGPQ